MNMLPNYLEERERLERKKELKEMFDDLDYIRTQLLDLSCNSSFDQFAYFKIGCLYETSRNLCEEMSKDESWFKDAIDKQNSSGSNK